MRKIIVVTGGAGFIGSHLCGELLRHGNKVICVDDLKTGRKSNIDEFRPNRDFSFVRHDVTKRLEIEGKVHEIYHLASPASPVDFGSLSLEILAVGSDGTRNMLELARSKKAKMLLSSTSEVYGDPLVHPQPESYFGNVNPTGPRAVYDEAKRFAEAMTMAYHRRYRLNVCIARIFNTYGPKMRLDDGRVVPNFIGQALAGKPLTVYGDGSQTRSFCYVSDMVAGLIALMEVDAIGPVNIGNPDELPIKEFAGKIIRLTGSKSRIVLRPLPQDDPRQRCPDISLAKKLLSWQPRVGLDVGLGKTIDYFRNLN